MDYRIVKTRCDESWSEYTEDYSDSYSLRHVWMWDDKTILSTGPEITLDNAGSPQEMKDFLQKLMDACDLPPIEEVNGKWREVKNDDND